MSTLRYVTFHEQFNFQPSVPANLADPSKSDVDWKVPDCNNSTETQRGKSGELDDDDAEGDDYIPPDGNCSAANGRHKQETNFRE